MQEEELSKEEIQRVLGDLRINEERFYPCFLLWLSTGLRNGELIGLSWECFRLDEGELLISKTLRRDGIATHQRLRSGTKTGKARLLSLSDQALQVLREHRKPMKCLGLNIEDGLVLVPPKTYGHLYDMGLEKVWKRSQRRAGLIARRLSSQRHSFLRHVLALGNSPADFAVFD